jgi:hypothetical protein
MRRKKGTKYFTEVNLRHFTQVYVWKLIDYFEMPIEWRSVVRKASDMCGAHPRCLGCSTAISPNLSAEFLL